MQKKINIKHQGKNCQKQNGSSLLEKYKQQANSVKVFQIINELKEKKEKYIDYEFKAELNSITQNINHNLYQQFKECEWLRPNQFLCNNEEIKVFNKIELSDIQQGCLGDCYFLASLSNIAIQPQLVMDCFNNDQYNEEGVYSVNFYIMGRKTEIIIDDQFCCYNKQLFFNKSIGNELWVVILEKAWCKLFGQYDIAEGGQPYVSLEHLTGAPSQIFFNQSQNTKHYFSDVQSMANLLQQFNDNKYLMAAGTKGQGEEKSQTGIVSGHAYTILNVYNYNQDTIIKLRNPWGQFEFNGKYTEAKDNPIWNDNQFKALVDYQNKDDGIFLMNVEEFQENYDTLSVCYIKPEFSIQFCNNLSLKSLEPIFFQFEIIVPLEGNLRVHQQLKEMVQLNDNEFDYSPITFQIYYRNNQNKQMSLYSNGGYYSQWGKFSIPHDDQVITKFQKGDYLIKIEVDWKHSIQRLITLSLYSDQTINFIRINYEKAALFLDQFYFQLAYKQIKKEQYYENAYFQQGNTYIIYYKNITKNQQIQVDIQLDSQSNNATFFNQNSIIQLNYQLILQPNQENLAKIQPINFSQSYQYSFSQKFSLKNI